MNTQMYDAQAATINVADITTDENNRLVLSNIKSNVKGAMKLHEDGDEQLWIRDEVDDHTDYRPEGARDMGWLGYFIGKHKYLDKLHMQHMGGSDLLEPFIKGLNRNKSIKRLALNSVDLLGGKIFTMLGLFFKNNGNLSTLRIAGCDFNDGGTRELVMTLRSIKHKSLQGITFSQNIISVEGMVNIVEALSMHPHLEDLELSWNSLSTKGCTALGTLLRCSCTEVRTLVLSYNSELDDEGIDALVPSLKTCRNLQKLNINFTPLITTRGWKQLATLLEAPNSSSLASLSIGSGNSISDEVVATLISALASNHTLTNLMIGKRTTHGDSAMCKLLCDTSSINAIYLSNHTLQYLSGPVLNQLLLYLLTLNRRYDIKKHIAMVKILQYHNDFDMIPFFQWEFKVLPLMIEWFGRASAITMPDNFEPNIGPRKLSSIYQFVRGMPDLYVETRLRKELEDIKAAESQMELKLQEFRKRKRSITERLGPQ